MVEVEPGVWTGRASSWGFLLVVVGVAASALFMPGLAIWARCLEVLIALIVLSFWSVVVSVDEHGLKVGVGPARWPRWEVPIGDVVSADVIDVRPLHYGGWGYRARPGVRAIVIRSGESLKVERSGAPDLIVTVDDAEAGAALLNLNAGKSGRR
ncbi:MAG: hypothetical protein QF522_04010 [Acidimicrobiales bacterium]|jgi:hypothetical protein|nr:hypothetical protein [Acidimicrobiales bacterium]